MNFRIDQILLILVLLLSGCSSSNRAAPTPIPNRPLQRTPSPQAKVNTPTGAAMPAIVPPTAATIPSSTPDNDPAYYFGGLEITLDNAGQTIPLKKGQNFLLSLGETYQWQVAVQPAEILSRNMKITPGSGEQGLYIARAQGKATLRAVGIPMCRLAQPPCSWPDVLFQIQVLIE